MRILLVVDSLEIGGAERHVVDLALALQAAAHEVVVACATSGPLRADLADADVPVWVFGCRPIKRRIDLALAWWLRQVLRREAFDLVHAHLYAGGAAAFLATRRQTTPLVITVHSEAGWQGMTARAISRYVYRRANALIAVSKPIEQQLVGRYQIPTAHVEVAPNALFGPIPVLVDEATRSRDTPLVGVVCRLQHEKGVDIFLAAMSRILMWHPSVRAVVVGDGPQHHGLEFQARLLRLEDHVQFLGSRPDARALMQSFDVVVIPSRAEGSPLVVLEAMAAGVAVVATRVGGIPDQICPGLNGLLVPPEDPEALADAVNLLLSYPELRRRLATEARATVVRRFAYHAFLVTVQRTYTRALAQSSHRESRPSEILSE